jgi:peptide/nickel transport system substrate-binding protein
MKNGYGSEDVDRLIRESQRFSDRAQSAEDFEQIQQHVADDVPLIPLWQRKEYVVSSEDVGGGQYLSDGTGVFRLWRLTWI